LPKKITEYLPVYSLTHLRNSHNLDKPSISPCVSCL
jgi:hypothetical protein